MNYYGYSGKKSKHRSNKRTVIIRVLIIVFAIAGSVAFGLVLGNHLKNKLDNAVISDEPIENIIPEKEESVEDDVQPVLKREAPFDELAFTGAYLDLMDCPDTKNATAFVQALKKAGYTGIIYRVKNENGILTYNSPAVTALTSTAAVGSETTNELLATAVSTAENDGMKRCAYLELTKVFEDSDEATVARTLDRAVVGELYELGFDRFILDGVFSGDVEFTSDAVNSFYKYFETLRNAAPDAYFGIVLKPAVFENAELTPTLELMFRYIDFFSVDFSDSDTYSDNAVDTFRNNFSGSLSAYRINILLDGSSEKEITDRVEMFSLNGRNISFLTPRTDYKSEKDDDGNFLYSSKMPFYSIYNEET